MLCRSSNGCGIVIPFTCRNSSKGISVRFIFLLPGVSGLFVSRLVNRSPLTSLLFQTISSGATEGNSESDVMLTTTCIACISVINYSRGVSKMSGVSFIFSNTKQDLSPRVETTLDSREQHPLPKFELNSIAYPHSSVSNPNASPVKKMPLAIVTSASLWLRIFLVLKRTLFICQYWLLSSPQQDKRLFLSHSLENYMHASFAHKKAKYGSKMQHEAFQSLLRNCFQMSLFFFFLFWRLVFGTWRLIITKNAYTGQFCNIIWA